MCLVGEKKGEGGKENLTLLSSSEEASSSEPLEGGEQIQGSECRIGGNLKDIRGGAKEKNTNYTPHYKRKKKNT